MQFNIPAEFKHASGVYIIRNTVNEKVYVGSAVNFWKRYSCHKSNLFGGKHVNKHLQAHAEKYGRDTLIMSMLEVCPRELLLDTEQQHLDSLQACNPEYGFNKVPNTRFNGSHLGNTATKGRKRSAEEIAKQVASRRAGAGYGMSAEQRQHQSQIKKGVRPANAFTSEAREKAVATRRANDSYTRSPQSIAKQIEQQTGRPMAEETKAKISATTKGRKISPDAVARQVAARKAGAGYSHSEETKAKIANTLKGRSITWTPEQVAKRWETRRARKQGA